jgi:hypothetical protein
MIVKRRMNTSGCPDANGLANLDAGEAAHILNDDH